MIYTTPSILEEVKFSKNLEKNRNILNKIYAAIESKKLEIQSPKNEYIKRINSISKKTGDFKALSSADKELLALTLELKEYIEGEIKIYSNDASEWLLNFAEDISQEYSDYIGLDVYPAGYAWNSDHASFWEFGYDAIFYHEYNFNDYYHSPQDTIENMNMTYCTKSTKFMIATLGELAQAQITSYLPDKPTLDGQTNGVDGEELAFTFSSTDPEGEDIYYFLDWGDGTNSGWLGPYISGETGESENSWESIGTFEVKVKARDINNKASDWSDPLTVTIVENERPEKVTINGPNWGYGGKEYEFTCN